MWWRQSTGNDSGKTGLGWRMRWRFRLAQGARGLVACSRCMLGRLRAKPSTFQVRPVLHDKTQIVPQKCCPCNLADPQIASAFTVIQCISHPGLGLAERSQGRVQGVQLRSNSRATLSTFGQTFTFNIVARLVSSRCENCAAKTNFPATGGIKASVQPLRRDMMRTHTHRSR